MYVYTYVYVSMCVYESDCDQAFAVNWLFGVRVPYVTKVGFGLPEGSLEVAEYSDTVLLARGNTPFYQLVLQSFVASLPDYPLKLLRWPEDLCKYKYAYIYTYLM